MISYDAIILGAGPAGIVTAIELQQKGWKVCLVEKESLPRQKVCGGFVGPENRQVLEEYGLLKEIEDEGAVPLSQIQISSANGIDFYFPTENERSGIGMSRKQFDFLLLEKAKSLGVVIYDAACVNLGKISSEKPIELKNRFTKETFVLTSKIIINATGHQCKKGKNNYFGGGALFENVALDPNVVALHFIEGAHVGINHFEGNQTNVCFVVDKRRVQNGKPNFNELLKMFKRENPIVARQLKYAKQVSEWKGVFVETGLKDHWGENGCFQVGDALGVVHPVVGGGISIAIQNGKILGQLLGQYQPNELNLEWVQKQYRKIWNQHFRLRILASQFIGKMSHFSSLANLLAWIIRINQNIFQMLFSFFHTKQKFSFNFRKGSLDEKYYAIKNR